MSGLLVREARSAIEASYPDEFNQIGSLHADAKKDHPWGVNNTFVVSSDRHHVLNCIEIMCIAAIDEVQSSKVGEMFTQIVSEVTQRRPTYQLALDRIISDVITSFVKHYPRSQ
jgi:hypothetical protein